MKFYSSALCTVMLSLILSCTTEPNNMVKTEIVKDFRMDVFDSLRINSNKTNGLLNNNKTVIIYLANSECSECIADFNDFNNHYNDAGIKHPCVYIISGADTLIVDYYLKQEKIKINNNAEIVYDTAFCFRNLMPQYAPNQIFILEKDSLVKRISKLDTNNKEAWDLLFSTIKNQ